MQRDELFAALRTNFIARVPTLRSVTISEQDSFRSLGANSLELSQAVSDTVRQLGLSISRDQLLATANIGELLDLMQRMTRG